MEIHNGYTIVGSVLLKCKYGISVICDVMKAFKESGFTSDLFENDGSILQM